MEEEDENVVCITCNQLALPGGETLEGNIHIIVSGNSGKILAILNQEADWVKAAKMHYYADIVTAGFVDIHHHGLGGSDDLVKFWTNPGYTQERLVRFGVTSFLASVVFPKDLQAHGVFDTLGILEGIVGRTGPPPGAVCEGIHAEGPIVNDFGGLPVGDNEMPLPEFNRLLDAMPSCRIMTISPHVDAKNKYMRIGALIERGIVPALGHDRVATEQEILGALRVNPSVQFHITHLFNVCSFSHRIPSLVNFGMTDRFPSLSGYEKLAPPTIEIIGDMLHVHPLAVSNLLSARHFSQVAFVSDCTAEAIPNKKISYSNRHMTVTPDGKSLVMEGTTTLAGSCCSVLDAFRSLVWKFHMGIGKAAAMVSENPARIANLMGVGAVKAGNRADLLLFDDDLNLQRTFVNGKPVFNAKDK